MPIKPVLLDKLSFSNFKAFKDKQEIRLGPMTLVFGYNNSGKSAILRSLPLLADSFKHTNQYSYTHSYLDYTSKSIRGASFRDIIHSNEKKMEFGICWDNSTEFKFSISQLGIEPEILNQISISTNNKSYNYIKKIDGEAYEFEEKSNANDIVNLSSLNVSTSEDKFIVLTSLMENFSNSVFWLNSTRKHPPREFEIGLGIKSKIEPNGLGTAETIWFLGESKSSSFDDINFWMKETCQRQISINNSSDSSTNGRRKVRLESIPTNINDSSEKIRVSVLDSGEGIAQALPVVTLCAQAANGELGESPIIVLEQPELHLHPQAVITLTEFLVRCINKNKNVRYIIETHSESFLIGVQLALVKSQITLGELNCYWVKKEQDGSKINKVIFDKDGYILDNWPEDVFRETVKQNRDLILAREGE